MAHPKDAAYHRYTGPMRLDKAIHTLEGVLKGITIDAKINEKEFNFLQEWLAENADVADQHPFNELMPVIEEALSDGVLDEEERQDIIWLCNKLTTDNVYFDAVTSDMQRLQAILIGIGSDRIVSKNELGGLKKWMAEHEQLRNCWPFDELEGLILGILEDGIIDEAEHKMLLSFFDEFLALADDRVLKTAPAKIGSTVSGVCAVTPDIGFKEKTFCWTGKSAKATRKEISQTIQAHSGNFAQGMSKNVDYLVIGADGNTCWTYACYGRKVEIAIEFRKQGHHLLIVHENDFWDAIEDIGLD